MAAVNVPSNPTVVLSTDRSKEELKHILDVVLEVPPDGPAWEALIDNGIETAHSLRVLSDDEIDGLQRLDKNNTTMSAADYFSQEHQVDLASVSAADFIGNISVNATDSNPSGPPDPGITPSPPREANVTRREWLEFDTKHCPECS